MPPSDFSGRGGRCGVNAGRLPETSGCAAIIGCCCQHLPRPLRRSGPARASSALSDAVMSSMLRDGGPDWRSAGSVDRRPCRELCADSPPPWGADSPPPCGEGLGVGEPPPPCPSPAFCVRASGATGEGTPETVSATWGRNGACDSAKPWAERFVSGVPLMPSRGGAGGLPDLPREGRGRGVLSLGVRGMGDIWRHATDGQPRTGLPRQPPDRRRRGPKRTRDGRVNTAS